MARLPFIGIPGAPKSDGVTISVIAHSNAAMTWVCGPKSGSVTLSQYGTDRSGGQLPGLPQACFTGTIAITGLTVEGLARYTCAVTQSGVTQNSRFRLKPNVGQKYRGAITACWQSTFGVGTIESDMVNETTDTTPILFWINHEDLGYVDTMTVNDDGVGGTGHTSAGAPQTVKTRYAYALAWMNRMGMLGDGLSDAHVSLWTQYNCTFQLGFNHDVAGLAAPLGGNNPFSLTAGVKDGVGYVTWNTFFGPLRGDNLSFTSDTLAEPWEMVLGSVKFVSTDNMTRNESNVMFGNNQIDDCLNALNTTHPIKVLLTGGAARNVTDGTFTCSKATYDTGAVSSFYKRLLVNSAQTPLSLSDNPKTNGTTGCCVMIAGEQHNGNFYLCKATSGAGIVAEKYATWSCGGATSTGHQDGTEEVLNGAIYDHFIRLEEGQTYNSCELIYAVRIDGISSSYRDPRGPQQQWTKITVHGDEYPVRMALEARRQNSSAVYYSAFAREWQQWLTDNYGVAKDTGRFLPRASVSSPPGD